MSKNRGRTTGYEQFKGCYIIPVMGPTGSGKSYFINELLGPGTVEVGDSVNSCTVQLEPVEVPPDVIDRYLPGWSPPLATEARKRLFIVDTPGFDDTQVDDVTILTSIATWLASTYGAGAKVAGVIYLWDICSPRVTGTTKRNFEVFESLCGSSAFGSVVLGTTKWGRVHELDCKKAEGREQELGTQFWKEMIRSGTQMKRLDSPLAEWELVRMVLAGSGAVLLQIQHEMEVLDKTIPQTEAAKVLRGKIEQAIKELELLGATKEQVRGFKKDIKKLVENRSWWKRFISR